MKSRTSRVQLPEKVLVDSAGIYNEGEVSKLQNQVLYFNKRHVIIQLLQLLVKP